MKFGKLLIAAFILLVVPGSAGFAGFPEKETKLIWEIPHGIPSVLTPAGYVFESVTISGKAITNPQERIENIRCPGWGPSSHRNFWILEFRDGSKIYTTEPLTVKFRVKEKYDQTTGNDRPSPDR